ncbi:hypothetical protein [Streptomyces hydrogenans]|uniref:hypothetical protein n=1 Tax=Streptomyces hydrogenans TaxID=1873719 RepID=UPI003823D479
MRREVIACAQGGSPAHGSPTSITSQRAPSRVDAVLAVLPPVGEGIAFRYERDEADYRRVRVLTEAAAREGPAVGGVREGRP